MQFRLPFSHFHDLISYFFLSVFGHWTENCDDEQTYWRRTTVGIVLRNNQSVSFFHAECWGQRRSSSSGEESCEDKQSCYRWYRVQPSFRWEAYGIHQSATLLSPCLDNNKNVTWGRFSLPLRDFLTTIRTVKTLWQNVSLSTCA